MYVQINEIIKKINNITLVNDCIIDEYTDHPTEEQQKALLEMYRENQNKVNMVLEILSKK